jgi:hypothetical protein
MNESKDLVCPLLGEKLLPCLGNACAFYSEKFTTCTFHIMTSILYHIGNDVFEMLHGKDMAELENLIGSEAMEALMRHLGGDKE